MDTVKFRALFCCMSFPTIMLCCYMTHKLFIFWDVQLESRGLGPISETDAAFSICIFLKKNLKNLKNTKHTYYQKAGHPKMSFPTVMLCCCMTHKL
jgi:hypothetical protein